MRRNGLLDDSQCDCNCGDDHICYTSIVLFVGWVLGALLAVGIYLVGSLPTCYDTTVLATITDTIVTTVNNNTVQEFSSQEVIECVIYAVPAAICSTLGILLYPAILISIVQFRRCRGDEDICSEDILDGTVIATGAIAGLVGGVGLILQNKMSTDNGAAGGSVLLIVVGITVWITLMCSKCYKQFNEDDFGSHVI